MEDKNDYSRYKNSQVSFPIINGIEFSTFIISMRDDHQ